MLDNASFHTSHVIREARKGLAELGIYLYHLPPYSPELNRIESLFRQVKHQEIPQRSHTTRSALRAAVEAGFNNYGRKLQRKSTRKLRPAAYTEEAIRLRLLAFKNDLLGPAPTPLDKVAVDAIALAWLALCEAHEAAADADDESEALVDHLERRVEPASKRLHRGLRTLDTLRRKGRPAFAIRLDFAAAPPLEKNKTPDPCTAP